ncbi:hypothetical protein [Paenibacillus sp. GCM10012303]|uniref:hypothetical protein n=1 Tax=Paenibacillus sp. GCM10012303 TaxID=3317340 RepID=UPI003610C742
MSKRIETDEAYDRSAKWLVDKAQQISDPLIDEDEKAKLLRHYDYVDSEMQRYRRGQLVKEFPGLRRVYAQLGWSFDEPAEAAELKQPETELPKQETQPPPSQPPAKRVSGFLDDDDD